MTVDFDTEHPTTKRVNARGHLLEGPLQQEMTRILVNSNGKAFICRNLKDERLPINTKDSIMLPDSLSPVDVLQINDLPLLLTDIHEVNFKDTRE